MKTLQQEEVQGLAYKDADDARKHIGAFHRVRLQHAAPAFGARLSQSGGVRTEAFTRATDGKAA
ncbi:hypothetical protein [Mesorhizobium sp.]|uniref:hypothetical protein n=1 Tax=Mesorhizobium sp. TaxID=1871066 RepID=UPI000FE767E4|nr:hypothetical protein [Mesorhizobium sp.]RWP92429.1 MAG: hypothetical protein EOR89_33080 [Mesorhizobium sp.]